MSAGSIDAEALPAQARPSRPPARSVVLRTLVRSLHVLPWPWGEHAMAAVGVARGCVQPARLRRALRWASHHRSTPGERWRLALALLANDGRFEAAKALLGLRAPAQLEPHLVVDGLEHLVEARRRGATMLLGFHFGPGRTWLALRLLGHPVASFVAYDYWSRWPDPGWSSVLDAAALRSLAVGHAEARTLVLHDARRCLRDGGTMFITADGRVGAEAFEIPVPGASIVVRSGWFVLRRHTGATTLPIFGRLEGRRRVVTIHPPLPPVDPDADVDRAACRDALAPIVTDYVRAFPDQCASLVLRSRTAPRWR